VKLVQSRQLPGQEALIFRPEDSQCRFEPLEQSGRVIMFTYVIDHVGHDGVPYGCSVITCGSRYDGFSRSTIRDNLDEV
jgi:hypothetical protein